MLADERCHVNSETRQTKNYLSYLLRLWQEELDGQRVWRASLESVHDGRRLGFASVQRLTAFLTEQTASKDREEDASSTE